MSVLKQLVEPCPLAMASFLRWINARNTIKPYLGYLRQPVEELPVEMQYGIIVLFLSEQGVSVKMNLTSRGRYKPHIYGKRLTGHYVLMHKGRGVRKNMEEAMKYTIVAGFRALESRLKSAFGRTVPKEPTELVIGLDTAAIMKAAREAELSCLPR